MRLFSARTASVERTSSRKAFGRIGLLQFPEANAHPPKHADRDSTTPRLAESPEAPRRRTFRFNKRTQSSKQKQLMTGRHTWHDKKLSKLGRRCCSGGRMETVGLLSNSGCSSSTTCRKNALLIVVVVVVAAAGAAGHLANDG